MSKYQEYKQMATVLIKIGVFLSTDSKRCDNFTLPSGDLLILDKNTGTFKVVRV